MDGVFGDAGITQADIETIAKLGTFIRNKGISQVDKMIAGHRAQPTAPASSSGGRAY